MRPIAGKETPPVIRSVALQATKILEELMNAQGVTEPEKLDDDNVVRLYDRLEALMATLIVGRNGVLRQPGLIGWLEEWRDRFSCSNAM